MSDIKIKAVSEIKSIEFEKHFIRRMKGQPRGQPKRLAGLTMVIEAEYKININGLDIPVQSQISSRLTADEFNHLRKTTTINNEQITATKSK